jgi:hypothetical protein
MLRLAVRLLAVMAVPAVLFTVPAGAQSPAPASTPTAADWVGAWRGPFTTDGPFGTLALTIERDGDAWKVTNVWEGEGVPPSGDVRLWSISGSAFSFVQTVGEFEVFVKGVLENGTVKGTLEAFQAGAMVGSGTLDLKKP